MGGRPVILWPAPQAGLARRDPHADVLWRRPAPARFCSASGPTAEPAHPHRELAADGACSWAWLWRLPACGAAAAGAAKKQQAGGVRHTSPAPAWLLPLSHGPASPSHRQACIWAQWRRFLGMRVTVAGHMQRPRNAPFSGPRSPACSFSRRLAALSFESARTCPRRLARCAGR